MQTIYKAEDGKLFNDKIECMQYENVLFAKTTVNRFIDENITYLDCTYTEDEYSFYDDSGMQVDIIPDDAYVLTTNDITNFLFKHDLINLKRFTENGNVQ